MTRGTRIALGTAAWASEQRIAKPVVIKGLLCRCGGCVEKVA